MRLVERCGHFRESTQPTKRCIQMTHENFTPPLLISLVELVSRLDVGFGGEEKNKFTHC